MTCSSCKFYNAKTRECYAEPPRIIATTTYTDPEYDSDEKPFPYTYEIHPYRPSVVDSDIACRFYTNPHTHKPSDGQ